MNRIRILAVFVFVACLLFGCLAQGQPTESTVQTFMVPMRDGVKLATFVAVPTAGEGPWPVVLSRTPYDAARSIQDRAPYVRSGLVRVVQDLRGRFASEGVDTVFMTDGWGELQDGYDTLEWIVAQPWCNGKVGTTGGSALGITQYLLAGTGHEALKCCTAHVAASNMYGQAAYPGGAFSKALVEDWMKSNGFSEEAHRLVVGNPMYNDVWAAANLLERAPQVKAPMVHVGGWYDIFVQGTLDAFDALQHRGGEGAKGNQIVVIGPWTHGTKPSGELQFPASALTNPGSGLTAAFLFHHLLGRDNPLLHRDPVYYYVMGACGEEGAPGNEWRNVKDWPEAAQEVPVYLTPDGKLVLEAPTNADASRSFKYDPANPVPTRGGCNLTIPAGPMDQRPVEERDDVLLFTSDPLPAPVEITGRMWAKLQVSSDCPDTDFTAKLTDVYPDGRSMLIADGILRMRFREGFDHEVFMEPGQVYEASIDLWSTSIILNKGHRLRLAISSSNAPRFDPNPNTGAGFRENDATRVATNTVHLSAEHPSRIVLPVRGG